DTCRNREDLERNRGIFFRSFCRDIGRDPGRSANTLFIQCEAHDKGIRHLYSADTGCVADTGSAVYEDVVVAEAHQFSQRIHEPTAAQFLVELNKVEETQPLRVAGVLASSANEPHDAFAGKILEIHSLNEGVRVC